MAMRKGVVGIIVNKRKKFLVLYRILHWKGWEFPKGGVEKGEIEENAILREIKEETGLDARIIRRLPISISYNYPSDFMKSMKTRYKGARQSVFLAAADGRVRLSPEHGKYRWASYAEAGKLLKHEDHKKALDAAMKILVNAKTRMSLS